MHLYVQLWKVKTEWLALSEQERLEFVYKIGVVIKGQIKKGADLVGFSLNDHATPNRADYRYVAVWRLANQEMVEQVDQALEKIGWKEFFEHANARGKLVEPQNLLKHMIKL